MDEFVEASIELFDPESTEWRAVEPSREWLNEFVTKWLAKVDTEPDLETIFGYRFLTMLERLKISCHRINSHHSRYVSTLMDQVTLMGNEAEYLQGFCRTVLKSPGDSELAQLLSDELERFLKQLRTTLFLAHDQRSA